MAGNTKVSLTDEALLELLPKELRGGDEAGRARAAALLRRRLNSASEGGLREPLLIETAAGLAAEGLLQLSQEESDELATSLVGWMGGRTGPTDKARLVYQRASAAALADAVASKALFYSHQIAEAVAAKFGLPKSEFASGDGERDLVRALTAQAKGFLKEGEELTPAKVRAAVSTVLASKREQVEAFTAALTDLPPFLVRTTKMGGSLAAEVADEQELLDAFSRKVAAHAIAKKVQDKGGTSWNATEVGRAIRELIATIDRALNGVETAIATKLMDELDIELPNFETWIKGGGDETEEWGAFLNSGGEHCSGVKEESHLEEHDFLIMPGWEHVHALKRLFDLDSVEWGFHDEYTRCGCGSCVTAVRTTHNSYSWQPGYINGPDGPIINEHMDDDDAESVISEMINDPRQCLNNPDIDPAKFGFRKVREDLQHGWYDRTDKPEEVLKLARKESRGRGEYIFVIDGVGQFHTNFSLWARKVPPRLVEIEGGAEDDGGEE